MAQLLQSAGNKNEVTHPSAYSGIVGPVRVSGGVVRSESSAFRWASDSAYERIASHQVNSRRRRSLIMTNADSLYFDFASPIYGNYAHSESKRGSKDGGEAGWGNFMSILPALAASSRSKKDLLSSDRQRQISQAHSDPERLMSRRIFVVLQRDE